jgi:hypothetical protein
MKLELKLQRQDYILRHQQLRQRHHMLRSRYRLRLMHHYRLNLSLELRRRLN